MTPVKRINVSPLDLSDDQHDALFGPFLDDPAITRPSTLDVAGATNAENMAPIVDGQRKYDNARAYERAAAKGPDATRVFIRDLKQTLEAQ